MTRIIIILSICFSAIVCFSQEQLRYYNSEHHFSFVLPEDWEYVPEDSLSANEKKAIERIWKHNKTVVLCQKIGADYFATPYIMVRFASTEEHSEAVFEMLWESEEGKAKMLEGQERMIKRLQKAEGCLPNSWKDAKRIQANIGYDVDKHALFQTMELHHKNIGRIIAVTVRLLGSHRITLLRCFADGKDADAFVELVYDIVDSFRYDEGCGFGEAKGIAPSLVQKLLGNTWQSWLLWAVGIIIVSWLIHRWVSG